HAEAACGPRGGRALVAAEQFAHGAGDDEILARAEDDDANRRLSRRDLGVRVRGRVRLVVELDAEEAEPGADLRADGGGALADPGREDERVEAAERRGHRADRGRDPVRVDGERLGALEVARILRAAEP